MIFPWLEFVNVLPLAGNTLLKLWNCKVGCDLKVSFSPDNPLPFILPVVCKPAEMLANLQSSLGDLELFRHLSAEATYWGCCKDELEKKWRNII